MFIRYKKQEIFLVGKIININHDDMNKSIKRVLTPLFPKGEVNSRYFPGISIESDPHWFKIP